MIAWLRSLDRRNALARFRKARGRFEALVFAHPVILKPPVHLLGSGGRTRPTMLKLFDDVLTAVSTTDELEDVWRSLVEKYPRLFVDEHEESSLVVEGRPGGQFPSSVKSSKTLEDLESVPKCPLCSGLLHPNGKVLDHVDTKRNGGSSASENARWVHPVCNSEREKDEQEAARNAE